MNQVTETPAGAGAQTRARLNLSVLERNPPVRLIAVGVVVLVGTIARFATLAIPSVWYDEAFHVYVSRLDLPELVRAAAADTLPPLSYILLHAWMAVTGPDEPVLRYFVSAWGVLTVPLTYVVGSRLWSRPVGLAAALIVATGPFFLYWSRELRMYSQMTFLGLLLLTVYLDAWRRPAPRRWLLLGLVITANLYTHSLSVLLLLALDLYALVQVRRLAARWQGLAVAHALALAGFLPWLLYLPGQMSRVLSGFWIYPPEPHRWFLSLTNFLTGMDQLGDPVVLPPWVLLGTLAACGAFAVAAAATLLALVRSGSKADVDSVVLLTLVLAIPIAALYLLAVVRSLYADRALGVSALALALLTARVAVAWGQQHRLGLVAGLPLLAALPAFWWALAVSRGLNHLPYAEVSRRLAGEYQNGDAVIYNNKASYFPGTFYATFSEQYFLSHPPGSRWDDLSPVTRGLIGFEEMTAEAALATNAPRVWLVLNGLDAGVDLTRLVEPLRHSRQLAQAESWRGDRLWLYRFDRVPGPAAAP